MSLEVGKVLQSGKYILGSCLGQGNYSTTYQATDTTLNRSVLVKVLNHQLQHHPNFAQFQKQFFAEARCIANFSHANLEKVLDFFEQDRGSYIVTEWISGSSLMETVQRTGPVSEARAIHYIRQVGLALNFVHQKGMQHRDINPKTMLRRQTDSHVILVNFGVAREAALEVLSSRERAIFPGFAPPEQYHSEIKRLPTTDVYGLAATLYYLLTGQIPLAATIRLDTPLPELRQFNPEFSLPTIYAVQQGMAMNAAERPQTVEAWLALLPQTLVPPDASAPKTGTYTRIVANPGVQLLVQPGGNNGTRSQPSGSQPEGTPTVLPPELVSSQSHVPQSAATPDPASPTKSKSLLKALALTSMVSIVLGIGVGLVFRFGAIGTKTPLLNREQTFPPRQGMPVGEGVKQGGEGLPSQEENLPPQ